jgi:hypothetical protein
VKVEPETPVYVTFCQPEVVPTERVPEVGVFGIALTVKVPLLDMFAEV